jgi:hypothetical protein
MKRISVKFVGDRIDYRSFNFKSTLTFRLASLIKPTIGQLCPWKQLDVTIHGLKQFVLQLLINSIRTAQNFIVIITELGALPNQEPVDPLLLK